MCLFCISMWNPWGKMSVCQPRLKYRQVDRQLMSNQALKLEIPLHFSTLKNEIG